MKALTKASRVNTALQVIQHMNDGMSVIDACRKVGMPRSSFYYFMENNPEAVAEVQAIIEADNREQLGLILASKTEMLNKVEATVYGYIPLTNATAQQVSSVDRPQRSISC
jgi:ACT domain-containing protein